MAKTGCAVDKIIFEEVNTTRRPYQRPKADVRRKLTSWEAPVHKVQKRELYKTLRDEALELGPLYSERLKKARYMALAGTLLLVGFASFLTSNISAVTVKPDKAEVQAPVQAHKPTELRYSLTPIRVGKSQGARALESLPVRATRRDIEGLKRAWPEMAASNN